MKRSNKPTPPLAGEHPVMYAVTAVMAVAFFVNVATASLSHAASSGSMAVSATPTLPMTSPDNAAMMARSMAETQAKMAKMQDGMKAAEDRMDQKLACTRKYTGCITSALLVSQGQGLAVAENTCVASYRLCIQSGANTVVGMPGYVQPEYDKYR